MNLFYSKDGGFYNKEQSRPISRVLSRTIIHLGYASLHTSSNLPRPNAGSTIRSLFGLAPSGVYHATTCYHARGALLPHHFNLTVPTYPPKESPLNLGGIFSAALSVGSRPPGVTWHYALWSPDFPPMNKFKGDCLADSAEQD